MTDPQPPPSGFAPSWDFFQNLMQQAAQSWQQASPAATGGVPGMASWLTPTMDVEELDKRIRDLRTVQLWLEQNAQMLGTSIQTLEVQKMTLATLQSMQPPSEAAAGRPTRPKTARKPRTSG
jgi:hypothetical protein